MEFLKFITPIIVLGIIFAYVIYKMSTDKGRDELDLFLDSIKNKFETRMIEYIDALDFSNFLSLNDAQKDILNTMYNELWELAVNELDNYVHDPFNKVLIKKYLTRKNIEDCVNAIFLNKEVQSLFSEKYDANLEEGIRLAIAKEEEMKSINYDIENDNFNGLEYVDLNQKDYLLPNPEPEIIYPEKESDSIDVSDGTVDIL